MGLILVDLMRLDLRLIFATENLHVNLIAHWEVKLIRKSFNFENSLGRLLTLYKPNLNSESFQTLIK